jgi:hypothetical protein
MNPATAKTKGRQTESLLVDWLTRHGVPYAERRRLAGVLDRGDIAGWVGVCVEVKSGGRIDLGGWMRELAHEQTNDHADLGLLVIRPKGKPNPDDWYAVMPLPQAVQLINRGDQ